MNQPDGLNTGENQLNNDEFLEKLYYDSESSVGFSDANRIWEYVKNLNDRNISKKYIKEWLSKQETYTLYRPSRKKIFTSKCSSFLSKFSMGQ